MINMRDISKLVVVEDVHKDEAAIIEVLAAIKENRLINDIKLLNYYKGLSVSFDASIEYIDRTDVEIKVHELQAAAMLLQKSTFIKSDHLPYGVIAKVNKVRKDTNIAHLSNLSYVTIPAEKRIYVRVKVSEIMEAQFQNSKQLVRGSIEDISFGGIAIKVPEGIILEEDSAGKVIIWLPDVKVEVPGKLINVREGEVSKKYIFELSADTKNERLIFQFIFKQQSKILKELKELCLRLPEGA